VIEFGQGDAVPNPTTDVLRLSFSIGEDGDQQRYGLRPFPNVDSALQTNPDEPYHYVIVWSATGGSQGGALHAIKNVVPIRWQRQSRDHVRTTGGNGWVRKCELPARYLRRFRLRTDPQFAASNFH
jgi:hypothetical protein